MNMANALNKQHMQKLSDEVHHYSFIFSFLFPAFLLPLQEWVDGCKIVVLCPMNVCCILQFKCGMVLLLRRSGGAWCGGVPAARHRRRRGKGSLSLARWSPTSYYENAFCYAAPRALTPSFNG